MQFRTEIGRIESSFEISHDQNVVMLGSCFTDAVGAQLDMDGFMVLHNPMGPMFNPASVARLITCEGYAASDLVKGPDGLWHCLDYASRFCDADPDILLDNVNGYCRSLREAIAQADVMIVTFGSSRVYVYNDTRLIAGNCHRLPAAMFTEELLSVDDIVGQWKEILPLLPKKIIFTLSPIRYTARGLVENSLSKATLRLAIDRLTRMGDTIDYFPAFEILTDDLRDYRFYADDLKHPSDMAVKYIYEKFGEVYFDECTRRRAAEYRRQAMRGRHINREQQ